MSRTILTYIILLTVVLFTSCNSNSDPDQQEYTLIWSDEFDGDKIDTNTWIHWNGPAYNNELQFYTGRQENLFVEDGVLHLVAQKQDYNGYGYTSARISTDSTAIGWQYGRFEARIRMPEGQGFWPAFWLMPMRPDSWPKGGEIDIMEYRGNEPYTTSGAVHFWRENCEGNSRQCRKYITDSHTVENSKLSEEFHVYALEWDDIGLHWFLDETEFLHVPFTDISAEFEPFSTPFYIILNLAVGGTFLPNPDESTEFPQALEVDYVRVYQKE